MNLAKKPNRKEWHKPRLKKLSFIQTEAGFEGPGEDESFATNFSASA